MSASMSAIDYIVFIGVLVGSSLIGVYYAWKGRKGRDEEKNEYLQGNNKMGVIPVSMSLVASLISSVLVLGIPAEIYAHSTQYWLSNLGCIIGIVVCDKLFLPIFYDLKLASINKYLLKRFDFPALRIVSSLSFIISGIFVSGAVVYGPALAISSVTPFTINVSIVAVGLVCTFYTAAGGMRAVIWTDVLQLIVMVAGMLMVAIQGTIAVGGWDNVWSIARQENRLQWRNFRPDTVHGVPTLWESLLGLTVIWAGNYATNQLSVQRFCSLPTMFQAKLSMYISIPFSAAFLGISCYCGLAIFANYYNCDPLKTKEILSPDQLMPYFVMKSLGYIQGLSGLFVAAVFCGSLSTLSSNINSMTLLTWDDFLKKFVRVSAKMEVIILKVLSVVYGLLTIAVAFLAKRMGSVLEVVLMLCGGIVGPQLGMFLLGAVCPFVDGKSAMVSFIFGQVVCMVFNLTIMITGRPVRRLPTSTSGCPAANHTMDAIVSLVFNQTDPSAVQTQPFKGFWIHNIAPFFMPFIGLAATLICGLLATIVTGGMDPQKIDPRYLSPIVRKYLRKQKEMPRKDDTADTGISLMEYHHEAENGHVQLDFHPRTREDPTM